MLPLLYDTLMQELQDARNNANGDGIVARCPFCGGSTTDTASFSIKTDPDAGEPVLFICFRASCGRHGALTTKILTEMGINDPAVHQELYNWNQTVKPGFDKGFKSRVSRDYVLVNLPTGNGRRKLAYINGRLGTKLKFQDLKDLKIQLSLLDMLRISDIRQLSAAKDKTKMLDVYCIGFISMYADYMICRDITPDQITGRRYYNYQIAGKKDKDNLKVYCIPRDITLLEPSSAIINVAEGPFSILGAYLNTDLGRERPNSIWLANCGSHYTNTIMRVCKQYGLLQVRINIWSDSEIPMAAYRKLYQEIRNRLDIRSMVVYYNAASDDFGHPKNQIKIDQSTIK